MILTLGFGAVAGMLSTLSPCVLPLIPIVLATAAGRGRHGPLALAAGLALSFTAVGLFVATLGFAMGLDTGLFRLLGAVILIAFGAVLLLPVLQTRVAVAAGPVAGWTERRIGALPGDGLGGQFGVGLLLGVVWAPCVGPTLGAASAMAARGADLGQVALTMLAFGLGAAAALLLLGTLSREAMLRWRGRMLSAGAGGRRLMGGALVAVGALILSGADKWVEALLVEASPEWLTRLTTSF